VCNAYSLSQATKIPRETVRRKISGLLKKGWIEKDSEGCFSVAQVCAEGFAPHQMLKLIDWFFEAADARDPLLRPERTGAPEAQCPKL